MLKHLWAVDIQWDLDGEDCCAILPHEVLIPDNIALECIDLNDVDEACDEISDWLSNEYGFCHKGFGLEWR